MNLGRGNAGLNPPVFVDRNAALRFPDFQHHHRFVRPCSRLQKALVGVRIDEYIFERRILRRGTRISHPDAGRQEDPLPVILGKQQLAILSVLLRHPRSPQKQRKRDYFSHLEPMLTHGYARSHAG